jgi:hypothetical protein
MWIWDMMPSWWYRPKKPLTKAQLRKMQESYKNADKIGNAVHEKEEKEQAQIQDEIDSMLKIL